MAVDVVTALYALQRPTAGLEHLAKLLSGNRLHNSISVTWASTPATALSVATSIQPCAASLMFDNVSGRSSPSDTHPGKPGTSAQKPPSSAGCTRTLSFMMHSIYRGFWWFKGARAYSLAQPLLIKAHRPDNPIFPAFGQAGNGKPVIERSPGGRDPAPGGRSRGPAQGPADALRFPAILISQETGGGSGQTSRRGGSDAVVDAESLRPAMQGVAVRAYTIE